MENKGASLVAHMVKNLGWEDPLEEGMATLLYSCLENPHGQRSLAGYSPWGRKALFCSPRSGRR